MEDKKDTYCQYQAEMHEDYCSFYYTHIPSLFHVCRYLLWQMALTTMFLPQNVCVRKWKIAWEVGDVRAAVSSTKLYYKAVGQLLISMLKINIAKIRRHETLTSGS